MAMVMAMVMATVMVTVMAMVIVRITTMAAMEAMAMVTAAHPMAAASPHFEVIFRELRCLLHSSAHPSINA